MVSEQEGQPRLRDIPSIAKTLEQIESFSAFKRVLPFVKPLLGLLGVDTDKVEDAFADMESIKEEARVLSEIPDRFNETFSPRGWIIHEDMNLNVAKEAIVLAEEESIDHAEQRLVDYYDSDEVEWMLQRMTAVEAFEPRMRLAKLALQDYQAGRYHACIPVVLALIDGLVSELHEERRGFFAEEADLTAWDSIAAHARGLNVLANLFQKGRRTLNTDPIDIPYRHGILHGWEMAYDNQLVAAKAWAALFAIRSWALKVENNELEPPPPEPNPTLGDLARQLRENEEVKKRIADWAPRDLEVGQDIRSDGDPSAYAEGTPERTVVEFLTFWEDRNYGYMARCLRLPFVDDGKISPGRVREVYEHRTLVGFEVQSVVDTAPSLTEVTVKLYTEEWEEPRQHIFRLIYCHPEGRTVVRGDAGGEWGIVNWYL